MPFTENPNCPNYFFLDCVVMLRPIKWGGGLEIITGRDRKKDDL